MRRPRYPSTPERFLYALITLFFAICACCGLGGCAQKPIKSEWAKVCLDEVNRTRSVDGHCDPARLDGFAWAYIPNEPGAKLPGVGDALADGTYTMERPAGVPFADIAHVDPKGNEFAR